MATSVSTLVNSRKIKFKAWDTASRLLLRLDSIECNRGELYRQHHILLQFTGLLDMDDVEIYEADVLLIGYDQYVVTWSEAQSGWYYAPLRKPAQQQIFVSAVARQMKRFCSYFELQRDEPAGNP
ncbi:MAG: YopX family protein [Cyclobacteriaceae bacterium]|nr:YopX family protein [Cyclobacteriaceae bacterium]